MILKIFLIICSFVFIVRETYSENLIVEAESFANKGGWVIDQQFMDQMGSPYLMAHGLGIPVEDASTILKFNNKGLYYVYVRTFNWTSPWSGADGAGSFRVVVQNKQLNIAGNKGDKWEWQKVGVVNITKEDVEVKLHDLTGFNGRCDAIFFTQDEKYVPSNDIKVLQNLRDSLIPKKISTCQFDFVVCGGGVAGMSAAVAASRLGLKVALVNDRPILGGNNSSDVRVHLGGKIESGPYKQLGNLLKEWAPSNGGNSRPAENYEDSLKLRIVENENNLTLFAPYRINQVCKNGSLIKSVTARSVITGDILILEAPLFADCTGDGSVGYMAGAHYRMGREAKSEYFEKRAPEVADDMTMGASVQWYSKEMDAPSKFPKFEYGIAFSDSTCEKMKRGDWDWETGMNRNQINEFERIRDYGLMVVFSNWSYLKNNLKNNNKEFLNSKLDWVAYVSGKRESRRLLGDYVLKEGDLLSRNWQEDGTAATTWSVDLHYPQEKNHLDFPGNEFKSIAIHENIYPYPIPYRCLYSRNINNLFMAGRDISVTHVALGTVRVMRTTAMMGEVVAMAASLCKRYQASPRDIYQLYLDELKLLMEKGIGKDNLPNNQHYNEGLSLGE